MTKEQSNPYSTGSGGAYFETYVQAAFALFMLTGGAAPCLPPWPIIKIKLQGRYAGFNTDDFIVFVKNLQTNQEAKLLAQIKHTITITEKDETFSDVILAAWDDFRNPDVFSPATDKLALITGPLSATVINSVRMILEWARHSEDENDFISKINTRQFSSKEKREKLEAFKNQLQKANKGEELTDKQLWNFLKHFYLLGYDLDSDTGSSMQLLRSLIAQSSTAEPSDTWAKLVVEVQSFNKDAGTLSLETLSPEIKQVFNPQFNSKWDPDIKKLEEHGKYIISGIKTSIDGVHIKSYEKIRSLLEISEEHNFVILAGERGSGKSSLLKEFAESMESEAPIFCFRTEEFNDAHIDCIFSRIGLVSSLSDLEAGFALIPKKYLLIESLEKVLELDNFGAFKDLLQFTLRNTGWTIIATCRNYALQQISFNYLAPYGIDYSTLLIKGFDDDDIQNLCEQLEILIPFEKNQSLKPLLKCPFYADLAYRVLITGNKFSINDGEKEFQSAVWREVISKESERVNGMPLRRQKTFIEVSVKRAKRMVYSVPSTELDYEALLKLEEDNLIQRDAANNLVSPAHDVLEDWALERYIDANFQDSTGNVNVFLNAIGYEPAMSRAFRIWLGQKLKYGENIDSLILSILNDRNVEKHWQDETITAVLLSEKPSGFLNELSEYLLEENCSLLKRVCFILRISCKSPDQNLMNQIATNENQKLGILKTLYLKPQGKGWEAIILFLFENKENLPKELISHVSSVLADWSSLIHVDKDLPTISRESGLLSIYLLNTIKDSYKFKDEQKKLLDIIIKVVPTITQEFNELLEIDLFNNYQSNRRPNYVDKLVDLSLTGTTTRFLCKHAPDTVIKIAQHEWLKSDELINEDEYMYSHKEIDDCFGIHQYRTESNFFPSSGAKGPFKWLLQYHPRKGIDFIVSLCNTAAERYANSDLDSLERLSSMCIPIDIDLSEVKQTDIIFNDGVLIKQYCSERLWLGYRGQSVVPYLLQSALMALENWLINCAKYSKSIEIIEWVFDYILKNSNSVLPTSVLASVSLGFYDKLGRVVLPLLRTPEFYSLDLRRSISEQGDREPNWFAMEPDPFALIYREERHVAALQPWRKENLEKLIIRLQFSDLRKDVFAILDDFNSRNDDDEKWRFFLHRIDTRDWKPELDKENSLITFTPPNLESDLEIIQKKEEEKATLNNRIFALYLWSSKTLKKEPLDAAYYENWEETLVEAKNLAEFLDDKKINTFASTLYGSIVKSTVIFLRDHSNEMVEDDLLWCIKFIIQTVLMNADTKNNVQSVDATDHYGDAASASVLPIILDIVSESEEILFVKKTIVTALTHVNENVRMNAAKGVREFMWTKDAKFALSCLLGTLEYARLMTEYKEKYMLARYFDPDKSSDFNAQIDSFRDKIVNEQIIAETNNISFRSHEPHHLLVPLLIIPEGSSESTYVSLLSQILELLIEYEEKKYKHISEDEHEIELFYNLPMKFAEIFADYFFNASDSVIEQFFLETLKIGCDKAPNLLDLILSYIQIEGNKTNQKERYWWFWNLLSETLQNIAINLLKNKYYTPQLENKRKLIRNMLFANISNQHVDDTYDNIKIGKDKLIKFVRHAGTNVDVFESMCCLMYYYPDLFLNSGLAILSKHQSEIGGTGLLSKTAVFYLEKAISRFLLFDNTKPLAKSLHEACKLLMDAIIETDSSEAYYLREHLVHSRKIVG